MMIQIAEISATVFDSILMVYFIYKFLHVPFRLRISTTLLFITHLTAILVGDHFLPGFSIPVSIVAFLIELLLAISICGKQYFKGFLSASIYEVVLIAMNTLVFMVISMLIRNFGDLMQGAVTVSRFIYLILAKVVLFSVLKLILAIFPIKNDNGESNLGNGLLTFAFTAITIIGLGAAMYTTSMPGAVNWQTPLMIITIAFLAVNILLYILIHQIMHLQRSEYQLKLLQKSIHYQETQHSQLMETWEETRRLRHDMKNHLLTIEGYIEQGEMNMCRQYMNDLLPTVEKGSRIVMSDNPTLDYLINSKLGHLKDTRIIISGTIGSLSDIRDTDLCCILGNILDNAVDATERVAKEEKRIELLFSKQYDNRIIVCKNTVAQPVLAHNIELHSTKEDPMSHGMGHKIIESIVASYHGSVDYFEEDDMFGIQILLPTQDKK